MKSPVKLFASKEADNFNITSRFVAVNTRREQS